MQPLRTGEVLVLEVSAVPLSRGLSLVLFSWLVSSCGLQAGSLLPWRGQGCSSYPCLAGTLLDYTDDHGCDRRLYSPSLCEKRDLYVYLPPGYDPEQQYPIMIWLHGALQDEQDFLTILKPLDRGMACGEVPRMIMAAPDGSLTGDPGFFTAGSFFLNSAAGRFQDYILGDVWGFVQQHFPIRPERQAHILAGASMGGFGVFNLGFKARTHFGGLVGIFPAINVRYDDRNGGYFANFNPRTFRFREEVSLCMPVARFGPITVRQSNLIRPLFISRDQRAIRGVLADENPTEMLNTYQIQPNEFAIFLAYGCRDQFNIDAQVESFIHFARRRGILSTLVVAPRGAHNTKTGLSFYPGLACWLRQHLTAYAPRTR